MIRDRHTGKTSKERPFTIRQTSKRQLSENERVQQHCVFIQKLTKGRADETPARYFLQTEVSTMTAAAELNSVALALF